LSGDAEAIAENVIYDPATWRAAFDASRTGILAYAPGEAGSNSQLEQIERAGGRSAIFDKTMLLGDVGLSPNNRRVALSIGDPSDIWTVDLERGVRTRITSDATRSEVSPVWSPDGEWIAYGYFDISAKRQGRLARRRAGGVGDEEVLFERQTPGEPLYPVDWSSDGRYLLYVEGAPDRSSGGHIWLLPLTGDRRPIPFLHTREREYDGQFSPDGRWMAFVSEETGGRQVYVAGLSAAAPEQGPTSRWQISSTPGILPRWRGDGRELFYLGVDNRIMVAAISTRGSDLAVDSVRPLFTVNPQLTRSAYDVTSDGQRFLVNTLGDREQLPMTIVVNWPSALGR